MGNQNKKVLTGCRSLSILIKPHITPNTNTSLSTLYAYQQLYTHLLHLTMITTVINYNKINPSFSRYQSCQDWKLEQFIFEPAQKRWQFQIRTQSNKQSNNLARYTSQKNIHNKTNTINNPVKKMKKTQCIVLGRKKNNKPSQQQELYKISFGQINPLKPIKKECYVDEFMKQNCNPNVFNSKQSTIQSESFPDIHKVKSIQLQQSSVNYCSQSDPLIIDIDLSSYISKPLFKN